MNNPLLSRNTGWFLLAFTCVATALAPATRAQTDAAVAMAAPDPHEAVRLDNYVVSASRTPQDPRFTPSAVSVITPADLAQAQVTDLRTALAAQPGVVVVNSGATGGQSSIFMRGANSDQVLLFVDGVRMNTADAGYANFLGGADLAGIDRLEILRGPQSTLYGSSAMGGVILIDTTHGCGKFQGDARASVGSFNSFGGVIAVEGGLKTLGYSASLASSNTDNERADNRYKQTSYSSRLEWTATPDLLVGMTVRGQVGKYDEAGSELFPGLGTIEVPNHLLTSYFQLSPVADFRSRLTGGWHQTEYKWTDKTYGPSSNFYTRNTRRILDWQNSWQAASWAQLVAGANAEWARYTSGGMARSDRQRGLYASGSFRFFDALTIDLGGRSDDHEVDGRADTWRTGLSYRIAETNTKFRSTYGTGFKAPSMINRFGSPPWYAPSESVKPEKSKGWDVGIDQELLSGKLTASVTYFDNRFDDLINSIYSSLVSKYVATNVKAAHTSGSEVALTAQPISSVKLRASYTYLSALDTSNSQATYRLIRRPRHTGDFDAQWQATSVWMIGTGLHFVSDRLASSTATSFVREEDYTTVRIYSSYVINEAVAVSLRIENALDEKYSEVPGYAALSRSVFGSVDWKF